MRRRLTARRTLTLPLVLAILALAGFFGLRSLDLISTSAAHNEGFISVDTVLTAPTNTQLKCGTDTNDQVDIILSGQVDVGENGSITLASTADDRLNSVLELVADGTDQVDVIDGQVDVDESGTITAADDMTDVMLVLFSAAGATDQVDVIDGRVDVDESG